ncbi:ankyrin repeat domain-containing protein [Roseivirga pacifica]|uniref:ankyrin repeat domain-containing protein n=1 Tax=Roseivirga pacifica TaxID=1267423 RepID=UPI002094276D|nr:ankyrin repeat domain-containing protein [Roseivirga pacifica]MCO6357980.1 hypothetical protein [Roseivirga pacifica]MCO6366419.1 hypothetical protein [Roseivirga pacifica]MCO6370904.1 hypothetical protein [Roseivirga pacifica]MCO6373712.1 hypothetical protein [Roseivirga pacifica]MCO6380693.1 hypothetical protein [Roseivirga pacifica]
MDQFNRRDIFYHIVEDRFKDFKEALNTTSDINQIDVNGMNLLHFACEYNRTDYASLLIEKGIDLNKQDRFGNTPLWKAVFNARGNYETVSLLIKNGSDPTILNNAGRSPLTLAKSFGDEQLTHIMRTL